MTASSGCPLPLAPLCDVASAGSGIVGAGAGAVLSAIVGWVVTAASWLLDQIGGVLSATTSVDLGASWYGAHYEAMTAIAGAVALPLLLLATVQAVMRQSPAVLVRAVVVELPLAGLLTAVALQLVQLSLSVTDALSSAVSAGSGNDVSRALASVATLLISQADGGPSAAPAFVVALGALLVVVGALMLWLELLVRASAVYVAVLFLPLALASLIWPAISHWCRRLVETLAALVLSKFVIVAVLSLAVGAVGSGTGFAAVLAGGALLLLAAFTPFTLLRLVPMVEAGAALQLEGARHRARQALGSGPSNAASYALRHVRDHAALPAVPSTEAHPEPEAPGAVGMAGGAGDGHPGGSAGTGERDGAPTGGTGSTGRGRKGGGVGDGEADTDTAPPGPLWQGDPRSVQAFEEAMRHPPSSSQLGTGGIIPGAPLPLWGDTTSPVGGSGTSAEGTDERAGDDSATARPGTGGPDVGAGVGPPGVLRLERDRMGPVMRWVPAGGGPPGPPGARAPGGADPDGRS